MKILSTFTLPQVVLNTKEDILKNAGNQTVGTIAFHSILVLHNCLVTGICQNIFFCVVQQKREMQVWNNLRVSK